VVRQAAGERDPPVAEREQVLGDEPHAGGVLGLDPRERARRDRMAGDDGGQPGLGEQREPRIVDLDVAQQEAVDPARAGEPLVGGEVDVLGHAQHEVVVAAGERALDAGQEAHEERVDLELVDRPREQQPDRPRARLRQRPRRGARPPSQLLRGVQDPPPRVLGHARPAVDGERHGGRRHAGARRHVLDRRPRAA
jgi:hypothetical protein